ncbi:MAG: hypothetical protein J5752_01305 [Clostridiales bacterium]|nr:hypothetical protein [Clostridiales bacterium]
MTETILNNKNVKAHSCPTCGGQLKTNFELGMYECPFCGVNFDYEYFREDDVLKKGYEALEKGEFSSAKDAFSFMLTKEPHNFMALRGKIFAISHISNFKDLEKADAFKNIHYSVTDCEDAIMAADPQDREYFTELQALLSKAQRLSECDKENQAVLEKRKKLGGELKNLSYHVEQNYVTTRDGKQHPKDVIKTCIVGAILVFVIDMVPGLGLLLDGSVKGTIIVLLATLGLIGIMALITAIIVAPKLSRIKKIEAQMAEINNEIDTTIASQIKEIDSKTSEEKREFRNHYLFLRKIEKANGTF